MSVEMCLRGHPHTLENTYSNGSCKLCAKLRYAADPDRFKASAVAWRKRNPDKFIKIIREYRRRNPDVKSREKAKRRTNKTLAGGSFTSLEWESLCDTYDNRCLCCQQLLTLTPDHVVPVSKGGTSNIENIQPLCQPCNSRKSTKTVDYRKRRIALPEN